MQRKNAYRVIEINRNKLKAKTRVPLERTLRRCENRFSHQSQQLCLVLTKMNA